MARLTEDDARHLLRRANQSELQIAEQLGVTRAQTYVPKPAPAEPEKRKNKYHAKRTESVLIGRIFDSMGERRCADRLYLRQQAGEISNLIFQPRVTLLGCVTMRVDFCYVEDGMTIHHEFKGQELRPFKIQRNLWGICGPTEYRVSYEGRPDEIIHPKPSTEMVLLVLRLVAGEGHERIDDAIEAWQTNCRKVSQE